MQGSRAAMSDWKRKLLLQIAPPLFAGLLKGLYKTCRIEVFGREYEEAFISKGRPVLIAFWHFSIFYTTYHFRNRNGLAMVSASKDGELMARTVQLLGYKPVRGSRTRGGLSAVRKLSELVKKGHSAGIVADGSQGPPRVVQKGVIFIAKQTGAPIIPVTHATKGAFIFNSWDKTVLSKPFSRLDFFYGEPLFVPPEVRGEEMEKYRLELENRMNQLVIMAENYMQSREAVRDRR